ncbi:MAG: TonB-dependent receptor [Acidobacteria bacterium]|nr:TonB-dependent receptor [Acidobacteriota bacterium]
MSRPLLFRSSSLLAAACWLSLLLAPQPALSQVMDGQLRVAVFDPSGAPVQAHVQLLGRNPQFVVDAQASSVGEAVLRRLPPGVYELRISSDGFASYVARVEIRSAVPQFVEVELKIRVVQTDVTVESTAPLLDPGQPSVVYRTGRVELEQALGTTLGRSTVDVITTMPGWLLEANAVLHPRGSEYDTQYVIDGMPVYDNRSIAFAPALENGEFEAISILTAGLPAEYGRRLGGVIALDTRRTALMGHHTEIDLQRGSFDSSFGSLTHQYSNQRTVVSLGVQSGSTDRYLDPPSLENHTNRGSSSGFHGRVLQDVSERDRLTFYFRTNHTGFLVPNDLLQQAAGQRQDRRSAETAAQVHYQRTLSARALASVRGMYRDLTAELWSNPLSTPIYAQQDRGLREGSVIADLTLESERHTLKVGGDVRLNDIREMFQATTPDQLPEFDIDFQDAQRSTEYSAYIQDQFRLGNFAANIGLRFDRYRLRIEDTAFSPRIAVSYYLPGPDLQLHASYDRIFQPPPTENLLLSSGAESLGLEEVEGVLQVPASRANFFEIGFRKPFGAAFLLDVNHYWRRFENSIDDDVFLNTGLSFPVTWDSARVEGTEVRLEMPRWRSVTSSVSYSNMNGYASSPVTGGLFLRGGEATELRDVATEFPITQDQRNTVAALVRLQPHRRTWFSLGVRYGSGLPVELEDDDDSSTDTDESEPISQSIADRVDFARGRVKPNYSVDLSAGLRVWDQDPRSLTLQFDVRNVTDRLNVINFSGLFSGTALAPGRQATVQMRLRF